MLAKEVRQIKSAQLAFSGHYNVVILTYLFTYLNVIAARPITNERMVDAVNIKLTGE